MGETVKRLSAPRRDLLERAAEWQGRLTARQLSVPAKRLASRMIRDHLLIRLRPVRPAGPDDWEVEMTGDAWEAVGICPPGEDRT